ENGSVVVDLASGTVEAVDRHVAAHPAVLNMTGCREGLGSVEVSATLIDVRSEPLVAQPETPTLDVHQIAFVPDEPVVGDGQLKRLAVGCRGGTDCELAGVFRQRPLHPGSTMRRQEHLRSDL